MSNEFAAETEQDLMIENLYITFLEARMDGDKEKMDRIIAYALDLGLTKLVATLEEEYGK